MPNDDVPADEPTDSADCWAELRTAVQQLESSMTEFQDAVTGLDSAFATVESSVNQPAPTPSAASDAAMSTESSADD